MSKLNEEKCVFVPALFSRNPLWNNEGARLSHGLEPEDEGCCGRLSKGLPLLCLVRIKIELACDLVCPTLDWLLQEQLSG